MSDFRTLGWFGPECSTIRNNAQYMAVSPQTGMPLEVAMKIFWEAATIRMEASCATYIFNQPSTEFVVGAVNQEIEWGAWKTFADPVPLRNRLVTAKQLLCAKKGFSVPPFESHTAYQTVTPRETFFAATEDRGEYTEIWESLASIVIYPQPFINQSENTIHAPFAFSLDNSGITSGFNGIYLDVDAISSPIPNFSGVIDAEFFTPWGNVTVPAKIGGRVIPDPLLTYMRIYVTAASAATRYA